MTFDVALIEIGKSVNGVVFTEETAVGICDRFYASGGSIPCIDKKTNQKIGKIGNLRISDGVILASLNIDRKGYKTAEPRVEQITEITCVALND